MQVTTELNQQDINHFMQTKWVPVCLCYRCGIKQCNHLCTKCNDAQVQLEVSISPLDLVDPCWAYPTPGLHQVMYKLGERVVKGVFDDRIEFFDPIKVVKFLIPEVSSI